MDKVCLILTLDSRVSPRLNAHPSYSYLLHAAEKWLSVDGKGSVEVFVQADSQEDIVLNEIADYTHFKVLPLDKKWLKGCNRCIRVNSRFPLLSEKLWKLLAGSVENLSVFNLKGDLLASVETGSSDQLNPVYETADSDGVKSGYEKVTAEDPVSGLNVSVETERIMAEAMVKSGVYPVHPVRYRPPYVVVQPDQKGSEKYKIPALFSAPNTFFSESIKNEWESLFDITYAWNAPESVTRKLLKGKEVWITGTCPPYLISREMMESATALKLIATPSTGTNHIDVKAAEDLGIPVCSIKTSAFLKDIHASSEHSFALLLAMMKKLNVVTEEARFGHWREREEEFRTVELHGRTIGLVGYGRIGSNMARYCHTFGMNVIVYDPFKEAGETWLEQVDSRDELLKRSEIVSLHYHLSEESKGSFGKDDFENMQDGACFLNTARGELVDEPAMIEALKSGKLRAAAVDVISGEDRMYKWDHPVIAYAREHRNLIVSPHTAGLTIDSESKAAMEILNEIKAHLKL